MDTYWVPAANNLRTLGRWAFAELGEILTNGPAAWGALSSSVAPAACARKAPGDGWSRGMGCPGIFGRARGMCEKGARLTDGPGHGVVGRLRSCRRHVSERRRLTDGPGHGVVPSSSVVATAPIRQRRIGI